MSSLENFGMHAGATPRIFENATKLRANLTKQEIKLWEYLRLKPNGFKFRRQHPFNLYILDFYCHALKLSIEIDGSSHNSKNQTSLDEDRTAVINGFGVKEIRFSNSDVDYSFDNVINEIESNFEVVE